jgi:hypothetical protein
MSVATDLVQCPDEWEYKDHPQYDPISIQAAAKKWLLTIRNEIPGKRYLICLDTRPLHKDFFHNLTPDLVPYFAGNYRGQSYFCLEHMMVGIGSDSRVGSHPRHVLREMQVLSLAVEKAIATVLFRFANPATYARPQVIIQMTNVVASAFVRFLTIHPYANGNGHASRFILNALFGTFDFWVIDSFPVHARPFDAYGDMIAEFRNGNAKPFITFLLNCLT